MGKLSLERMKSLRVPEEFRHLFEFSIKRVEPFVVVTTHFYDLEFPCYLGFSELKADDEIWEDLAVNPGLLWVFNHVQEIIKVLRLDLSEMAEMISTDLGETRSVVVEWRLKNA